MKYRKKPIVIEATQWFKSGDHPMVDDLNKNSITNIYYDCCGKSKNEHGWINTLKGGHLVCPGDWIITGINGEHYPVKCDIFNKTYDKALDK